MNFKDQEHHCQCGHEHEEHHEHCDHHSAKDSSEGGIKVTHHEGATIYSVESIIEKEYVWVRDTLARELKSLGDWVEDKGDIVGHIKAFLTESGYSTMLSTTGGEVQIKENRKPKVTVNLAIIVFVENEGELYSKITELLETLLK